MFGRMKDPADGTATVVSYSEHHQRKGDDVVLDAEVIVQAEGLVPTTVDAKPRVPQSWMPVKLGTEWPVRVDRANPERLEFRFDRVQGGAPAPAAPAGPAPVVTKATTTFSVGTPSVQVIGGTPEQAKQAIDMAEQMTGMDIDGDGKVAGGAPAAPGSSVSAWLGAAQAWSQQAGAAQAAFGVQPPAVPAPAPAPPASDDPVSKLERLAKLLDEGAITRDEFDAEKKKILGAG
jgi:hypothetical protein